MKRIPLFEKKSPTIIGWACIDDEDHARISKYKWHMSADGRAVRERGNGYVQMGRDVMNVLNKKGILIEHLDGDTLNNQKSNLKIRKDTGSK